MSISGDVETTSSSLPSSTPGSASGSPRCRAKFLCSYGGKILPRPADAHLKYVGGETRVVSVPRNITFTDLMKKLSSLIEGGVILKYQLIPEELDALVTVKSDEDLCHMFEEYDRNEIMGSPRLRTFLFPANPIIIENQMGPMDRHSLEERYINSVNGIIFSPTPMSSNFRPPPTINTTKQPTFTISSACSSPRTPPDQTTPTPDVINPEIAGLRNKLGTMTRARSSPSLCNLGGNTQINHKNPGLTSTLNLGLSNQQYPYHHQYYRQPQPQTQYLPPHHNPQHHPHQHSSHSPKPPLDPHPHKNSGVGPRDYYREHAASPYTRGSRGGHVVYQRGSSPYDEYYGNNINRYDRESPPGSPLALQSNYISKWDPVGGRPI